MLARNAVSSVHAVVPVGIVAAAQPYQTQGGPALSVNFLHNPDLFPFQRRSFTDAGSCTVYQNVLLRSLAEFCETPRPTRQHVGTLVVPPMKHFWRSVGVLNTTYATNCRPGAHQHPATGSVELVTSAHRKNKDVRLALHSADATCLAFMVMSGPQDVAQGPVQLVGTEAAAQIEGALQRRPLLHLPQVESTKNEELIVGDVVPLQSSPGFAAAFLCPSRGQVGDEEKSPVAPWIIQQAVGVFANKVGCSAGLCTPRASWLLVASHLVNNGDILCDEPAEIVCAAPRHFEQYFMPPWKHQVGMPQLQGQPCLALRVEVRQQRVAVVTGTYFFAPDSTG